MTNGETHFESLGFTDGYQADYISVQCVVALGKRRMPDSVIQRQWNRGFCLSISGIVFSDDTWIELTPHSDGKGYRNARRVPIDRSVLDEHENWIELEALYSARCNGARYGDLKLSCGGTCWEGDGFVSVTMNSELAWVLLLEGAERFVEVTLEDEVLVARSEEYPFKMNWRIPVDSPQKLTKSTTRL